MRNIVDMQLDKIELRRVLLEKRQSMSVEEWREKSDRICQKLQSLILFDKVKTILAYFSFRQEPDLSPLFADSKYKWGFPRCIGKSLSWHVCTPGDLLQINKYGISEPHPGAPIIDASEVDLILVPSVACDQEGFRLGYGGGYYDRLLSSPEWANKPTMGIVFDFAFYLDLPREVWDKPLQGVATESRFISRRGDTALGGFADL